MSQRVRLTAFAPLFSIVALLAAPVAWADDPPVTTAPDAPATPASDALAATPALDAPAKPAKSMSDAPAKPLSTKAKVLVIAFPDAANAAALAAKVQYIAETAVRRSAHFEAADIIAKLDPAGSQVRMEAAERGNDALVFGRKSYDGLEEGLGIESFDRAIAAFQDSAIWENIRGYVQASMMRILLKWADDPTTTKHEISNLLTVDPKAEFPREISVPADLAAEVTRQRDGVVNGQHTSFDLSTDPVPARVYVDGVYRGTTPVTVDGLAVGDHFASFVAPGYEVSQQQIHVAAGGSTSVSLKQTEKGHTFYALIDRIKRGFSDADEVQASLTIKKLTGADDVLAVSVSRHEATLDIAMHRLELKDGHCASVGNISIPENDSQMPASVSQQAQKVLAEEHAHCGGGTPCLCRDIGGAGGTHGTPVDMTGVRIGTGVSAAALIAAGVSLAVVAKLKGNAFALEPQITPTLKADGQGVFIPALASDICNGLGLVMAGVWAYVTFGIPFNQKSDILGPSTLEQVQDPAAPHPDAKPEPVAPKDDPFNSRATPALPAPTIAFSTAPVPGGFAFSLQGTF